MKLASERAYADPETAARKLVAIAAGIEPVDGRVHIEKLNAPFLFTLRGSGPEFGAGIKHAIDQGWLDLHESGTYVRLLSAGEDLLAP
nr:hypothetical protein [Bradyrhizobium sp. WSM3983]